jgi:hypothetical protein
LFENSNGSRVAAVPPAALPITKPELAFVVIGIDVKDVVPYVVPDFG